jgi:hypothetical protein
LTNDKADEIATPKVEKGIIFKNDDISSAGKHKEEGLFSLPGLGLEKDMLEPMDNDSSNFKRNL